MQAAAFYGDNMVCKEVYYGRVGTSVNSEVSRILLQVENQEEGESFQQARASLTVEQACQLIEDLRKKIDRIEHHDDF